jgi:protein-disulfide isomerase
LKLSTGLVLLSILPGILAIDGAAQDNAAVSAGPVVRIVEFADFQCPFCARQAPVLRQLQAQYPGRVTVVFKNFPLPMHSHAWAAHQAALAAGEQGKFWEMHDLIFAHPGRLSDADFDHYAGLLGLDKDRFHAALRGAAANAVIETDIAEGKKLGITATPTLLVDGHRIEGAQSYAALKQISEAELKGEKWKLEAPEGSAPVKINTDGAPSKGERSAAVTIVEFSDFQCPFCAKAVEPLDRIMADNEGKLRWVFKNFPLRIHADAPLAHRAALAAGEQGKFWEMHDLIFAHQKTIKRAHLLSFASELKLDLERFQKDLDDPRLGTSIQADQDEGIKLGVRATPTFIVNGEVVPGFSLSRFQQIVQRQLANAVLPDPVDTKAFLPDLDLTMGPQDAPIKIEWYADLGSPLTARSAFALQQFLSTHGGLVRVQFRNFPLPHRDVSMLLHEFTLAAAVQGKFWAAESLLLADDKPKDRKELDILALQLGLDRNRLWKEIEAGTYVPYITRDLLHAKEIGVTGTPTFVVGGRRLDGVNGLELLEEK